MVESWSFATRGKKPVSQTSFVNHFDFTHGDAYRKLLLQATKVTLGEIYTAVLYLCWDKMSQDFLDSLGEVIDMLTIFTGLLKSVSLLD